MNRRNEKVNRTGDQKVSEFWVYWSTRAAIRKYQILDDLHNRHSWIFSLDLEVRDYKTTLSVDLIPGDGLYFLAYSHLLVSFPCQERTPFLLVTVTHPIIKTPVLWLFLNLRKWKTSPLNTIILRVECNRGE